ncbi:MAG: hypothetical protein ACKO1H_19180 [Tabrizicola sp.]
MDLISAVRSTQPIQHMPQQSVADRTINAPAAASTRPVTDTQRRDAVQSPSGTLAQVSVQLADRDRDHHPAADARAAAIAAREAYIQASIAAGISPLPMP